MLVLVLFLLCLLLVAVDFVLLFFLFFFLLLLLLLLLLLSVFVLILVFLLCFFCRFKDTSPQCLCALPRPVGWSRGDARNSVDRINPVTCEVDLKTVERLQLELKIEAGVQRLTHSTFCNSWLKNKIRYQGKCPRARSAKLWLHTKSGSLGQAAY